MNFADGKLLLRDLAVATGAELLKAAGGRVDGIVGGPPCQGFSSIGVADPNDPRRALLGSFFRIVSEIGPKFFVMENVRGLLFEKNRHVLDAALEEVANDYEIVGPFTLDAADYGAPTRRRRVFVLGYMKSVVGPISLDDIIAARAPLVNVEQAISDLHDMTATGSSSQFDEWAYGEAAPSSYALRMRSENGLTTGHRKIAHKAEVADRFSRLQQGETDKVGRYPKLAWNGLSPTIRAGTGADKGSYQAVRPLHPSEPRVITVREAARLQGFPDWFRFHPTTWHSFRMIGNSVSPLVAQALLEIVHSRMDRAQVAAE